MKLKKLLGDAAACALLAGGAMAETIGYSSNNFDDNFQAILRTTAEDYAKSLGHELQVEVARKDVDAQLSQVQNLIAAGVDAIIVPPVSTEATSAITEMVKAAGIPLIYINRRPADVEALGASRPMSARTMRRRACCWAKPSAARARRRNSWLPAQRRRPSPHHGRG
jgi:inositol transport system substrate-binding protein